MKAKPDDSWTWVTGSVCVPPQVIDAHAQGRLVLFVGAGASVDRPSGLPLFGGLANELADLAGQPRPNKHVALDFFLGSMPDGFPTKAHAQALLTPEGSRYNRTHTAIVELAAAGGHPPRIVTTNFDDHLMAAAQASSIGVERWVGPALPLGDAFDGVVHLHGSVTRDPDELVLTDRDFGLAYLTRAWATRFLLPMFNDFTVLFIGYSHDDPIMRYLSLGLPSGSSRYALTSERDSGHEKWIRLGITPIPYPSRGRNHSAMAEALESWTVRTRMGRLQHEARMQELVSAGPTLTPVDHDYVVTRLGEPDGSEQFARAAAVVTTDVRLLWLRWLESRPAFAALFNRHDEDASAALGWWFATSVAANDELTGAALQTIQRLGPALSPTLARSLAWATSDLQEAYPEAAERLRAFLATSVPGVTASTGLQDLVPAVSASARDHLATLRAGLTPRLELKRRWYGGDRESSTLPPDADIRWAVEGYGTDRWIQQAVQRDEGKAAVVLEQALCAAYDLLDAYRGETAWDSLSFRRAAIESHSQNTGDDTCDVIIDALRDWGVSALDSNPDLIERWWGLERDLFRRLALHLLSMDQRRTSDEKIGWLMDRSALYERGLKHETFGVLAATVSTASPTARASLLDVTSAGPSIDHSLQNADRHFDYAIYNVLVWLTRHAPGWAEAAVLRDQIQAKNDFQPREAPDFDRWTSNGTWGGKLPVSPADFTIAFDEDPVAAVNDLVGRDYGGLVFDQPEWRDAHQLISQVVHARPDIGLTLWPLCDDEELSGREADLRLAAVDGWSTATIGERLEEVVVHVSALLSEAAAVTTISRFLLAQVETLLENDSHCDLTSMRRVAAELWDDHGSTFTHRDDQDPLAGAPIYMNSWPGDLAQFWVKAIDLRWRRNRDDWYGLDATEKQAVLALVEAPAPARDATVPAIGGQVFFLTAADEQFAREVVIPLFSDPEGRRLAWYPFLHQPRWNDRILALGLLDATLSQWQHLGDLDDALCKSFYGLVASIVSYAAISDDMVLKLLRASVLADSTKHAEGFAATVARFVADESVDGSELWKSWLGAHVRRRVMGNPRVARPSELSHWEDAVPYLGDSIPDAVHAFASRAVGLTDQFHGPMPGTDMFASHGLLLVEFYASRIRNSPAPSPTRGPYPYQVRSLIEAAIGAVGRDGARPMIDAAREAGFSDAGD